ncbi:MAG: chorismate-binding protein, partial [Chitinophagaceae bacterium]|nr:chorismate-binding protein [Chitinophagaceae bacterium]
MTRATLSFTIENFIEFKTQMLGWANQFNICVLLDNHQYIPKHHQVECLLGVGAATFFEVSNHQMDGLKSFINFTNDWLFGHACYNFNNQLSTKKSSQIDGICFPELYFFQPETVIELQQQTITISCLQNNPANIFEEIKNFKLQTINLLHKTPLIVPRISKDKYLTIIHKLKQHILRGDCYEINFCQEFFAEHAEIDTLKVYELLSAISPNPFSC